MSTSSRSDGLAGVYDRTAIPAEVLDIEDAAAVAVWLRSLDISEEELRAAVREAGPEVGALYDHLQRTKQAKARPIFGQE